MPAARELQWDLGTGIRAWGCWYVPLMPKPLLKKRFGQHHLVRAELCAPLIRYLRPHEGRVIEVGPGGGVLSKVLLAEAPKLLALELDPEWAFEWVCRCKPSSSAKPRLAVADAMKVAWDRVSPGTLVTGNLPYEIATALIRRLLPLHDRIPRLAFLVQREVAERLVAVPGSRAYGLLAVLAAAWSDAEILGTVARGSFNPPPKVEGAFIGFSLKQPPLPDSEMSAFVRLIELSFSQRRKTLRNALASRWGRERADRVLETAGFGAKTRAEELALEGFVALHEAAEGA